MQKVSAAPLISLLIFLDIPFDISRVFSHLWSRRLEQHLLLFTVRPVALWLDLLQKIILILYSAISELFRQNCNILMILFCSNYLDSVSSFLLDGLSAISCGVLTTNIFCQSRIIFDQQQSTTLILSILNALFFSRPSFPVIIISS